MTKKILIILCILVSFIAVGCKNTNSNNSSASSEKNIVNNSKNNKDDKNNDSKDSDTEKENTENKNTTADNSSNTDGEINTEKEEDLVQFSPMQEGEEYAVLVTNMGEMKIRFFSEYAPKAVENFKTHAIDGYYDKVIFHRVVNDFMIQSGDPLGNGRGGESIWGKPFEDEFSTKLHNFRGALSMANVGANTNGSQFFIVQNTNLSDTLKAQLDNANRDSYSDAVIAKYKGIGGTPFLDYKHTVFAQVFEGMDVVDKIASVEVTGSKQSPKPLKDIIIKKIKIEKYHVDK